MTNYVNSIVGVTCPYCGFNMPIPSYMGEYEWKNGNAYKATHDWYCVNCGEKHTIKVKRHIHDAEVVRVVGDD